MHFWLQKKDKITFLANAHQSCVHTFLRTSKSPKNVPGFKQTPKERNKNVALRIGECKKSMPLFQIRFLETILSHVEMLFGAICRGKRDTIYYLLHSIIVELSARLR